MKVIHEFKRPTKKNGLISVAVTHRLGYYRRCVPGCANVTAGMTDALSKSKPEQTNSEQHSLLLHQSKILTVPQKEIQVVMRVHGKGNQKHRVDSKNEPRL